ncbi:MAG TPA: adenylyl-sulfate kinase [Polyangia bacterium]|nr:adenylyl-sulfate kinase [Polyangia bacterium]
MHGRAGSRMSKGFALWFTGMSGAGKSTLSQPVAARLKKLGHRVEVLDGDVVRTNLSAGLTFSKEDRDINVRRIGFVANLLARNGVVAITAAISPYRNVRDEVRALVTGDGSGFVEVFVTAPVEVLAQRDVKGLYKKALAGEIGHFTGVSDPYEPPPAPEVVVDSASETVEVGVEKVLAKLRELGYVGEGSRAA